MSPDHGDHQAWLERLEAALAEGRTPDEAAQAHIGACVTCRREWVALQASARRMHGAAGSIDLRLSPPAHLRNRVRAAVLAGAGRAAPHSGAPGEREPWRVRLWSHVAWATAGAAIATVAVLTFSVLGQPRVTETFTLIGSELAPDAVAEVAVRPLENGSVQMTLKATNLPPSQPGEFYELWWVGPEKRHLTCGTFVSDGSPVELTFTSAADLTSTVLVELTLEADDGDPGPGPHVAQSPAQGQ